MCSRAIHILVLWKISCCLKTDFSYNVPMSRKAILFSAVLCCFSLSGENEMFAQQEFQIENSADVLLDKQEGIDDSIVERQSGNVIVERDYNSFAEKSPSWGLSSDFKEKKAERTVEIARKSSAVRIDCNAQDAEVYLNGEYQGKAPLYISNLASGVYRLNVRKEGYVGYKGLLRSDFGKEYSYYVNLLKATGYLNFVLPEKSYFLVDGQHVYETDVSGLYEIPVGKHRIEFFRYGYKPNVVDLNVRSARVYEIELGWIEQDFEITSFTVSKNCINPLYKGKFSNCVIGVSSLAPGKVFVSIVDMNNNVVYKRDLQLSDWLCTLNWDGTDSDGFAMVPGRYEVRLSADGFEKSCFVDIVSKPIYHPFDITVAGTGVGSIPCAFCIPFGDVSLGFALSPTISSVHGFYDLPVEINVAYSFFKNIEACFRGIIYPALDDGSFCASIGVKGLFSVPFDYGDKSFNYGFALSYGGMGGGIYEPYGAAKNLGLGTALMVGFDGPNCFAGATSQFVFGSGSSNLVGDNTWKNSVVLCVYPSLFTSLDFWFSKHSCFGVYDWDEDKVRLCEDWNRAFEWGVAFSALIPDISSVFRMSYDILMYNENVYHEIKLGLNLII